MKRRWHPQTCLVVAAAALTSGCDRTPPEPAITLVVAGQALIKEDPRQYWDAPFGSLRPILQSADVAFTNFEMAVRSEADACGLPDEYEVVLGGPRLTSEQRPGNSSRPHAVDASVMEFLATLGFNLMSIANNHAWDLGDCGVAATRAAADTYGLTYAGAGRDLTAATAPAYLTVKGVTIGLVAATTSHDERDATLHAVNGVWTGRQDDWDRNLAAVREAASHADFVIYYQHFQIDADEFDSIAPGEATDHGHVWVEDVAGWQMDFARAVIDAGASMYVGHGHRGFDGIEIYKGKPLIRQLGGFAYQGLNPEIGAYDRYRPWEGLLVTLTIRDGAVVRIEFTPLHLDEGEAYRSDYDVEGFLARRGLAEIATRDLADSILLRLRNLSADYGTELTVANQRAVLELEPGG
jgi:poly-gamma-glutamate capsule biosynthesis protein CapA/YwtB (metallophosphatase superfamily)